MDYLIFICLVASAFVCLTGLALYYKKKTIKFSNSKISKGRLFISIREDKFIFYFLILESIYISC